MRLCMLTAALALPFVTTFASADTKPAPNPVSFGMLSGNTGCVIFAEGHKTTGHFYGIAATTKSVGKLTVIEAMNYTTAQKEILETQENLDALLQTAQQDHVKFVKIPEKYAPELLERARSMCKETPGQ